MKLKIFEIRPLILREIRGKTIPSMISMEMQSQWIYNLQLKYQCLLNNNSDNIKMVSGDIDVRCLLCRIYLNKIDILIFDKSIRNFIKKVNTVL